MAALLAKAAARVGVLGAAFGTASAEMPDPGDYSAATYEWQEHRGVMVSARDAQPLAVDLYVPKTTERASAVLTITPYDRGNLRSKAQWFAQRGYVFVAADSRGRFGSGGSWDPFDPKHGTDGHDLVEWVAKQRWSNGRVGMWGPSYMGWTQWWTATTTPPHLAAIVATSTPADQFENGPYQSGVLTGGWMPDWVSMMSGRAHQAVGAGPYGGWLERRFADFKHTPYAEINSHRGLEQASWVTQWYAQNKSTDPYWQGIAYQNEEQYSKINVPSLSITGWFDVSHPGSPTNFMGMRAFGATPAARHSALMIGPWDHGGNSRIAAGIDYGADAVVDQDGYAVRWFDHFLKGIDNGLEKDPPVHVFVMGENKWHAEQGWPLSRARATRYYLASNGRANSAGGGGLLTATPPRKEGFDTYDYDPRDPTLDASNHNGHLDGAWDTQLSARGRDVLVYQTPALREPVEVIGPIEAVLYAATSARDTDWMVRLVDVHPDGRALLLADGAIRARNRDPANQGRFNSACLSKIEPGKVYQYTVRFWRGTANLFRRGHRIRIEISSSWYPFFLPNLNSGADNLALVSMSEAVIARQAIHHGPRFASHVVLPVVPCTNRCAKPTALHE